jgi:hypothetical protein
MPDDTRVDRIRAAYAAFDKTMKTTGYPPEFKALVVDYARSCREQGLVWKAIGERLPISITTARSWLQQAARPVPGALVPVVVVDQEPVTLLDELVLTSPGGYRLTGINLEQATALLRSLG